MLQWIGWLGCVYLVVKALLIPANSSYLTPDGQMKGFAVAAAALAWISGIIFGMMFLIQGSALSGVIQGGSSYSSVSSGYSSGASSDTEDQILAADREAAAAAAGAAAEAAADATQAMTEPLHKQTRSEKR